MRRVREYGRWKAGWWIGKIGKRSSVSSELLEGITAYAEEHAARELSRVQSLNEAWDSLSVVAKAALANNAAPVPLSIELEQEADGPDVVD